MIGINLIIMHGAGITMTTTQTTITIRGIENIRLLRLMGIDIITFRLMVKV